MMHAHYPMWLIAMAGFMFGAILGSGFGVVFRRVIRPDARPQRISYARQQSCCLWCGKPIPPYLNVPVLGWILLRGRTACCGKPIGSLEILLELGFALSGMALAMALLGHS